MRKLLKLAEVDLIKNAVLALLVAIAFAWAHFITITGFFALGVTVFVLATILDMVFALIKRVIVKDTVQNGVE